MTVRAVLRYVTYLLRKDETAEDEFAARCVWGDETECGAESGNMQTPEEVHDWQVKHTEETRHNRYRRVRADYQLWVPTEHVPPAERHPSNPQGLEPAKVDRVKV
ncbi:hypothetical protein ACFYO2_26465 [Streptomyces sp. NPDC006602]|uniref:DUF7848 domain-containing protein n=1 Tax=Streptomyces sp. NPDC006602 TaxID=3364751 RepID=UPI003693DCB4